MVTLRTPSIPDNSGIATFSTVQRGVRGDGQQQHRDVVGAAGQDFRLNFLRQGRNDTIDTVPDVGDHLVRVEAVLPLDGDGGHPVG
jgi:hypothetical protein